MVGVLSEGWSEGVVSGGNMGYADGITQTTTQNSHYGIFFFRYNRYFFCSVCSIHVFYSPIVFCTPLVLDIFHWKYPEGGGIMASTYLYLLLLNSGRITYLLYYYFYSL